jgi:hypothetical protein
MKIVIEKEEKGSSKKELYLLNGKYHLVKTVNGYIDTHLKYDAAMVNKALSEAKRDYTNTSLDF